VKGHHEHPLHPQHPLVGAFMRLGEKFKQEFKWHLLTAFFTLIVIEIFDDGFQPIVPTLIVLLIGSVFLGLCLFIGDWLVSHFIDGLFKGLKRVKGLLFGELHKEERDR
jgi:hypothetical protein